MWVPCGIYIVLLLIPSYEGISGYGPCMVSEVEGGSRERARGGLQLNKSSSGHMGTSLSCEETDRHD